MPQSLRVFTVFGLATMAGLWLGLHAGNRPQDPQMMLLQALAQPALAAGEPQVLHFGHDKADFTKNTVLIDGSQTNYKVNASRRDKAGVPELHARDTDIFYIRSGKATFITGGKVNGLKTTGADEAQGVSIDGGKEHALTEGDVIIIPKGIPHWFREVPGEVTYFVVKVR